MKTLKDNINKLVSRYNESIDAVSPNTKKRFKDGSQPVHFDNKKAFLRFCVEQSKIEAKIIKKCKTWLKKIESNKRKRASVKRRLEKIRGVGKTGLYR